MVEAASLAELRSDYFTERSRAVKNALALKDGQLPIVPFYVTQFSSLRTDRQILANDFFLTFSLEKIEEAEVFSSSLKWFYVRLRKALHSLKVEKVLRSRARELSILEKISAKQTQEKGERILRLFVPVEIQSDLIGDVEEEFILVTERHGEKYAKRWFWWQVTSTSARYFVASIVAALTGKTGSK